MRKSAASAATRLPSEHGKGAVAVHIVSRPHTSAWITRPPAGTGMESNHIRADRKFFNGAGWNAGQDLSVHVTAGMESTHLFIKETIYPVSCAAFKRLRRGMSTAQEVSTGRDKTTVMISLSLWERVRVRDALKGRNSSFLCRCVNCCPSSSNSPNHPCLE